MPVVGIVVQIIPVVAVLAVTGLVKAVLLPFTALRQFHRNRAARA